MSTPKGNSVLCLIVLCKRLFLIIPLVWCSLLRLQTICVGLISNFSTQNDGKKMLVFNWKQQNFYTFKASAVERACLPTHVFRYLSSVAKRFSKHQLCQKETKRNTFLQWWTHQSWLCFEATLESSHCCLLWEFPSKWPCYIKYAPHWKFEN